MNKEELADVVEATGEVSSKAAAKRVVGALLEKIAETLEKGNEVRIAGFGNFSVSARKARDGRNPHTGETIKIKKKKVVKFKAGTALKERVDY